MTRSTETVGHVAAEFLVGRTRGSFAALTAREYATHQMARTLPAKAAQYYGALGVLVPEFGLEHAISHAGPRILRGCMVAMAVNCWQNPNEALTGEERAQRISTHLRMVYGLIHQDMPSTITYKQLQAKLLRALQPPIIPEEGMGELGQAVAWIAELTIRQGVEHDLVTAGTPGFVELMEKIRSLASRLERAPTSAGRMEHLHSMATTASRWMLEKGSIGAAAEQTDELYRAIRPLAEGL